MARKKLMLVICLGFTAYFGVSLGIEIHENRQGAEFYAALPVEFVPRVAEEQDKPSPCLPEPPEPEIIEPFIDFDAVQGNFPSIVGWIQSEGTVINYPVVQGLDNDFYLHHLPDETRHPFGSIFLDYRNAADFSDAGILIYGHSIRGGDMFGSLRYYANQDYFDAHPHMLIFTPERDFILRLFAGYVVDSAFEVPPMQFENEARFNEFIADIRSRSFFSSDVRPEYGDALVFLCTCTSGANTNDRLIIAGVLCV